MGKYSLIIAEFALIGAQFAYISAFLSNFSLFVLVMGKIVANCVILVFVWANIPLLVAIFALWGGKIAL